MRREISHEEKIARIRLYRTERVGPITYWNLLRLYKTAMVAIDHLPGMARAGGCKAYQVYDAGRARDEYEKLSQIGGRFVFTDDADYPKLLKMIPDRPPFISVLGRLDNDKRVVAIVGARNASLNAQKFCYRIARDLSDAGVVICSGMARGIDIMAHEGSIAGGTVAVLAGGVDVIYPPENAKLYDKIKERGAVISESAFGIEPQAMLFPKRNRLIAGMSAATVVAEAAIKSGSLITAKAALEYGRDVFAVPGFPDDPRCKGSNMLIKNGAILLENAEDVLANIRVFEVNEAEYDLTPYQMELMPEEELSRVRSVISGLLSYSPVLIDDLIKSCDNNTQGVLVALIELELAGRIVRLNGQRVCLRAED